MQRVIIFGFSISYLYLGYILAALTFANGSPIKKQHTLLKWDENFNPHIVNGVRVNGNPESTSYNFMVALKIYIKNDPIPYNCGGSMIQDRTVLTAAHCLEGDVDYIDVLFFNPADPSYADKLNPAQTIRVSPSGFKIHPDYDGDVLNDIAILQLGEDPNNNFYDLIEYKMTPSQVSQFYSAGQASVVAGWGTTETGFLSRYLLEAAQSVIANRQCSWRNYPGFDGTVMFCAMDYNTPAASCGGDSGGPLFVQSNGAYYVIGLTSWGGNDCLKEEGVYTRVNVFEGWITNNLAAPLPTPSPTPAPPTSAPPTPVFVDYRDCKYFVKDAFRGDKVFCKTQYQGRENKNQRKNCLRDAKNDKKDRIENCKDQFF